MSTSILRTISALIRANGKTLKSLPDSGWCICKGAGRNLDKLLHKCHFVSRVILVVGRPEFDAVLCRPPLLLHSQSTPDQKMSYCLWNLKNLNSKCICGWNNCYDNKITVKIYFLQTVEMLFDGILQLGCHMIVAYFQFCLGVLYMFYNFKACFDHTTKWRRERRWQWSHNSRTQY
jgi:hypothetical protein